jgi:PAS domain S-box-containing protein
MINKEFSTRLPLWAPFRAALDDIPDALAVFTAADSPIAARIVYVNSAFERLSGYTRDEVLGHSSMLLAGARPDLRHVTDVTGAAKDGTFFASTRKFRPDGTRYDVDMWLSPLRDESGAVTHYLLRERDVTGRDRERPEGEVHGRLAESLTLAGQVAAGTAYELEQPLATIDLHLSWALDALESDTGQDVSPAVRHALAGIQQIRDTTHGLEAFLEPDEEAPRSLDVHEAIENALKLTKVATDRRALLVRRYGVVPLAKGSLRRLTHVLFALLRNAASAIPAGSPNANSIVVATSTTLDGRVQIEIMDTGVGIEKEDLQYVFEPFFTTKSDTHSVGLGLAAARAAVIAMAGAIEVESTCGRGTRVRVVLPACPDSGSRLVPECAFESPPTRRVLCVAASPADAARISVLFDGHAAHVLCATFEEAVEDLTLGGPYDLVACDGLSGRCAEFRTHLRESAPDVLSRTFDIALASHGSGLLRRVTALEREVDIEAVGE